MTDWESIMDEYAESVAEGPFYTDYLINVQEDYPNIGLASVPWNQTETPKLYALKDIFIEHFNFIYKYREIGAETESRWQYTVDRVFDNVKRKYEFALSQYDLNDIAKIGKGFVEEIETEGTTESTTEATSENTSTDSGRDVTKNQFNDTPIQPLIASENYATYITDAYVDYGKEVSSEGSRSDSRDTSHSGSLTRTRTEKDKSDLELVNDSIKYFRDLIDDFVDEFHVCFISTLGRI